jgi:phosphoglucomutase
LDYSNGLNGLPKADILAFDLIGGTRVYIRPSGTEPKVKLYVMARAQSRGELDDLIKRLSEEVQILVG